MIWFSIPRTLASFSLSDCLLWSSATSLSVTRFVACVGCEEVICEVWGCEEVICEVWGCEEVMCEVWGCEETLSASWSTISLNGRLSNSSSSAEDRERCLAPLAPEVQAD